ncbi:uncharacterized protein LOC126909571 [Daktulosphaira vitifoliae]|uniref:uncharacterized protein LOC126909571 n=1 Tax=Daktulosphaira vitifoliae TaxID=58002 RepID=UPI0021AA505B|nr:uncharacterized protein LOC126909571 [Daktulosphaira vitifoliae]
MVSISYALLLICLAKICTCEQIDLDHLTLDIAKKHLQKHDEMLSFVILNRPNYTGTKLCEQLKELCLNDNIDIPVSLDESNKATSQTDSTPFVLRTLQEITDDALNENNPLEAIVWLINVIESMGLTLLANYNLVTAKAIPTILEEKEKFSNHFNKAKTFFNFLLEKFKYYRIDTEPVDKVISIYDEYNRSLKLEENKQEFNKKSKNNFDRFVNRTCLVKMPNREKHVRVVDYLKKLQKQEFEANKEKYEISVQNLFNTFYTYIDHNVKILKDSENTGGLN